jgi:hypothetical protein
MCPSTKHKENEMAKTLFLLISDGGDGSQSIQFSFDDELVGLMQDDIDFAVIGENWMSGDGLQVTKMQVPDECTMESMGISQWSVLDRNNYTELFNPEDDEDD